MQMFEIDNGLWAVRDTAFAAAHGFVIRVDEPDGTRFVARSYHIIRSLGDDLGNYPSREDALSAVIRHAVLVSREKATDRSPRQSSQREGKL